MKSFKNKAFTLAEVLITLVIIGVVAAMTVPVLMNNTNDIQFKSALKKNYSVFNNAFRLAQSYDYDDFYEWDNANDVVFTKYAFNSIKKYLHVIKVCGNKEEEGKDCWEQAKAKNGQNAIHATKYGLHTDANYAFVLNDGTSVALESWATGTLKNYAGITNENNLIGNTSLVVAIDVNGNRKPNVVGKDVFLFILAKDGLIPAGMDNGSANCENRNVNYNWDCTAKVLLKNN